MKGGNAYRIFFSANLLPIDWKEKFNENKEKEGFFNGIIHGFFGSALFKGVKFLKGSPIIKGSSLLLTHVDDCNEKVNLFS